MEFLKEILGEGYAELEERINQYNKANPDKPIKLANLSEGGYVSKQKYDDLEAEVNGYKEQIKERDKQLDKLKADPNSGKKLQDTIEQLQKDNKTDKENFEKQLSELRFNSALDMEILKAKALDSDMVKVKLDKSSLKLAEDGTIAGLSEQLEDVRKNFGFLFESNETRFEGVKPAESGKGKEEGDPFLQGFEG